MGDMENILTDVAKAVNKPKKNRHRTGYYGTDGSEILNCDRHSHTAPLSITLKKAGIGLIAKSDGSKAIVRRKRKS